MHPIVVAQCKHSVFEPAYGTGMYTGFTYIMGLQVYIVNENHNFVLHVLHCSIYNSLTLGYCLHIVNGISRICKCQFSLMQ